MVLNCYFIYNEFFLEALTRPYRLHSMYLNISNIQAR